MKNKFPKITTKFGDSGYTKMWSGETIHKSSEIIEFLSFIDLFDSSLGLLYRVFRKDVIDEMEILDSIKKTQERLIYFKGEISTDSSSQKNYLRTSKPITDVDIDYLEKCCEKLKTILETRDYIVRGWVLDGEAGHPSAQID